MTVVPRYRHACKQCGRNMLNNPKSGLCGDCATSFSKDKAKKLDEHFMRLRQLEMELIVLDHKDYFDMKDQAEATRIKGLLLSEYRKAFEVALGRSVVDLAAIKKGDGGIRSKGKKAC